MTVVVLGSINEDLVFKTPRLPRPGETIRASDVATFPGGKGANQAVAAARMGASVALIGRVGRDAAGERILDALRTEGIDTSGVGIDDEAPTGRALITVAADGSNTIVTGGGANHRVGAAELDAFGRVVTEALAVLIQLEIPMAVVEAAAALAAEHRTTLLLDPAPVSELSSALYRCTTWITPNEHEAADLTGMREPHEAARDLHQAGVDNVAVTLGARGCLYVGLDGTYEIAAAPVDAVDTVACGDAFTGALAARLVAADPARDALRWACAAGADAATREGASPSLPTTEDARARLTTEDL